MGGPLTIHTDLATGRIRRVRPIVLTDDDAPGWVIKAHGKEYTPQRKTTLSLLGFTEKDRTYSYDRIKYPMIREDFVETPDGQNRNTENRGKSGYRRASWDEALGLVAREIKRIQGTYGKEAVTAITSSHHSWGLCGYKISLFKRFSPCWATPASWTTPTPGRASTGAPPIPTAITGAWAGPSPSICSTTP